MSDTAYGLDGEQLATLSGAAVTYFHADPFSTSRQAMGAGASDAGRAEYDPLGAEAGSEQDYAVEAPDRDFPLRGLGAISAPINGCVIDGMSGDCRTAIALVRAGGARMSHTYDPLPSRPFYVDNRTGEAGFGRYVPKTYYQDRPIAAHYEFTSLEPFGSMTPVAVPLNPAPDSIGTRCSPTAKQLAGLPQVKIALEAAWRRSHYGRRDAHEEGGWILADGLGRIKIVNGPRVAMIA